MSFPFARLSAGARATDTRMGSGRQLDWRPGRFALAFRSRITVRSFRAACRCRRRIENSVIRHNPARPAWYALRRFGLEESACVSAALLSRSPPAIAALALNAARADVLIRVDKSAQIMTVTVDGEQRYAWKVSTGIADYDTPEGDFHAFRMERDHFCARVGRRADALFDLLHPGRPRHPRQL